MKNLIAELLVKLAQKEEEAKELMQLKNHLSNLNYVIQHILKSNLSHSAEEEQKISLVFQV